MIIDLAVCLITYDNTILTEVTAEFWEHGVYKIERMTPQNY